MKAAVVGVFAALLFVAEPAFAHRLDEYLQATLISVDKDRIHLEMRLAPGVAVLPTVLSVIDTDADGVLSDAEQRAYAENVLRDISLTIDGRRVSPHLVAWSYSTIDMLKDGMGDIRIELEANAPRAGGDRRLTFENHHQPEISAYLVNAEAPTDPDIQVVAQTRNYLQSFYRLDYLQAGSAAGSRSGAWFTDAWSAFSSVVPLGVRHIAQGTDHLLFILVLLLPAPLVAVGGRWTGFGGVRQGVLRLIRIVTAFTIGHSLTLAAAAGGWMHAPVKPVEVLIALSILVSAVHAIRPIFPGREAFVAAAFGLVHGLAFATLIAGYGIDPWHTTLTVLGFNVGIELMQIAVLVLTVPWLLSLARTPWYRAVRVTGAVAAGVAAIGWVGERALGLGNPVGLVVASAAAHAPILLVALALLAVVATVRSRFAPIPATD
ncbi:MAG TPA: HupE/UreJ family protein [Gemmatimonadaceae bacterium]|nr:HupE/UreJ family protein [Gemmatimonadaceae bacterium]